MSKSIQIDIEKKVVLIKGWNQIINFYYAPIIMIAMVLVIFVFQLFNERDFSESIIPLIGLLPIALVAFVLQKRQTKMAAFKIECSQNQLEQAFINTANMRGWDIENSSGSVLVATDSVFSSRNRDLIVVVNTNFGFMMTTLSDPRVGEGIFYILFRNKNKREFINQLKGVINNQTWTPRYDADKSEWTLKKTLIRFIAYPFCILLIIFGIMLIKEPLNHKSQFSGLGAIMTASVYLFYDITLILKKRNRQKRDETELE